MSPPADKGSNGQPSVELRDVTKRFGDFTAVDDLSLAIGEGEFFTLLGPSGCGKTTTLRMVAGFEEATEGQVLIDGADVVGLPPYRRPTNTVFQSYALFPHLSVSDNVAFGLQRKKVDKAEAERRVNEELERVGLAREANRRPAQLSGGQQQRVALARALVNFPKVLLLDEPLGALDLKLRKGLQVQLKQIQREVGITFVYVTHDQEEALTMSDRIAVMNHGRIEQVDNPELVYERPASTFVAGFIGVSNLMPGVVREGRRSGRGRAGQRRQGQGQGRRLQGPRALLRGCAPREARDRQRRAGEPERRGPGGKLAVPGHRDPDDRATPRRGQDDRAGAERRRGRAPEAAGRGSEGKAVMGAGAHASRAREPCGGGGIN